MKKVFLFLLLVININTASLEQLDKITGIGPVMAQRIIDARPFSSVDDLDRVKGIGEKTLQKIKDQGLACVTCEQEEIAPPKVYPDSVFITEILPNPEGADETDEYIKLYNSNNFEVDLADWKIQDTVGTITTYTIPKNIIINKNDFLVFKRPETKIILNNEGDGINLLSPDNKIRDCAFFTKAPLGAVYTKTSSGWKWPALPKKETSAKNKLVEPELATASLSLPARVSGVANPWTLFFITLAAAIISATSILLIKLRFKKHVRT